MKKLPFLILLVAVLAASCERDVVPMPTSKVHFTVSSSKRVKFSKGNLQHNATTGQWRMAATQTEYLANPQGATALGWDDLFDWDPEGWNLDGWRCLTHDEWHYLLTFRTNAPKKRGLASVEGVNGLVILPDGWQRPADIPFRWDAENYSTNAYTLDQWGEMEAGGAVFLPAAGNRREGVVSGEGREGYYWSTTPYDDLGAWNVAFQPSGIGAIYGHNRTHGYSVRLVLED